MTVNVTFVVTESLNNNKTVDDNLKDISELNCQVTGIDPQTGKEYSYNSPGYGGSMIAALNCMKKVVLKMGFHLRIILILMKRHLI